MKKLIIILVVLFMFACDSRLSHPLVVKKVESYADVNGNVEYKVYLEQTAHFNGDTYFYTYIKYNVGDTLR